MEKKDTTQSGKTSNSPAEEYALSDEMEYESDFEDEDMDSNYDEEAQPEKWVSNRSRAKALRRKKKYSCPQEMKPFGKELGSVLGRRTRWRLRKILYPEKRKEDPNKFGVIDKNGVARRIDVRYQPIFKKAWNEGLQKLINAAEDKSIYSLDLCRFEKGIFTFYVSSEKCVPVLKKMVEDFPKLWRDADLQLLKGQRLPQLRSVTILIPKEGIEMPTELILQILASQNNGLKIDQWEILGREEITEGVLFYAEIDKISTKVMNKKSGRAYFLSEVANFRFGMQSIEGFQSDNELKLPTRNPKIRPRTIAWRELKSAQKFARKIERARENALAGYNNTNHRLL